MTPDCASGAPITWFVLAAQPLAVVGAAAAAVALLVTHAWDEVVVTLWPNVPATPFVSDAMVSVFTPSPAVAHDSAITVGVFWMGTFGASAQPPKEGFEFA